ncbi:hypothetical protein EG68_03142 [Paragonimus skrjabini miyazakii]|uniref:Piezo-type mechanosensitive ion channel component n=1 Tax=Paragonimus skrjabini miyazakii TaxID=59628 RepID=A0A8S9Z2C8_9TREM|nr:hypothetical protein EG68_03142 [Paragonimus skrjabini miyazakii]
MAISDTVLLRVLLPAVLFLVTIVRYNGFSFIYLVFLLACPLLPHPAPNSAKSKIQIFLILLITLSCIFTLSHPTLHIVLAVAPPYDDALTSCEEVEVAAQIGVQRLNGVPLYRALRLVLPDIVILATAVGILVYLNRRGNRVHNRNRSTLSTLQSEPSNRAPYQSPNAISIDTHPVLLPRNNCAFDMRKPSSILPPNWEHVTSLPFIRDWDDERRKLWRAWAVDNLCLLITVLLICVTGISSPSILSSVYLLSFLGISTYWACRKKINPIPFASLRIFLLVYSGLHVCLYYLYQFPFFQTFCRDGEFLSSFMWKDGSLTVCTILKSDIRAFYCACSFHLPAVMAVFRACRFLGLYYIMRTSCDKPGEFLFPPNIRTVDYITPLLTMLLFYALVFETRRWFTLKKRRSSGLFSNAHNVNTSAVAFRPNENLLDVAPEAISPVESANLLGTPGSSMSTNTVKLVGNASTSPSVAEVEGSFPAFSLHPVPADTVDTPASDSTNRLGLSETHPLSVEVNPAVTPSQNLSDYAQTERRFSQQRAHYLSSPSRNETGPLFIESQGRKPPKPHVKLSHLVTDRIQPHFDALFGLTPPFVSSIYGNNHNQNNNVRTERPLLLSLHCSVIRNSYIVTLIAMMAWAVAYRSWLSFILLLSACILWISPNSRSACLYASPLIVLYAIVLILIQYVYCMNLTGEELPQEVTPNGLQFSELGMQKWPNPVGALGLQITFLVSFWLTLRLFVNERSERWLNSRSAVRVNPNSSRAVQSLEEVSVPEPNSSHAHRPTASSVGVWFGTGFPFGNVDNSAYRRFIVIFRIFYMVMLIYFMFTFQVSYRFWRRQMIFFWWFNVVYSMAILLCIYTYQFQGSPEFWQRTTGLSEEVLKDIGLETFASAALFERLLTPVLFLVVIILQVHYFHEPFLKRSALNRFSILQSPRDVASALPAQSLDRSLARSHSTTSSLSNFMEDVNSAFHTVVSKLSSWAISLTNCCWRFLEIHWIKLIALLIVHNAVNEVTAPNLVSLVILVICFPFPYLHGFLATIAFVWNGLLTFCKMCFQLNFVQFNITIVCDPPLNTTSSFENPRWIGLVKVTNFNHYIMPMGALMTVCVCWHAIACRQRQFYNDARHERPREGIVFPQVTIDSFDKDLRNVVKFAINYGFYKFGLELCYCVTVVTACLRADAFSVLYLALMLIFLFTPRDVCAKLWLPYLTVLGVLIPVQYASCVGLPPGLCWAYPWLTNSVETDNLLQWLFLPGAHGPPTAKKLTADFFQFVAVALQYQVFKIERGPFNTQYGGGSNKPVLTNTLPGKNERDFVSSKESYLDYLRHLIFYWSYWVSLAIVLATGVTWITLFCLGYMILSFIYLWMGQNVMLRKRVNLIKSWNVIIGYNFCVILAKCSLQVIGCVYSASMSHQCWFIQLFGVQCMDPLSWSHFDPPGTGAYLINQKLMSGIREQAKREQYSLEKIREKLDAIQRRQAALGRNTANITEHYVMLRSGDYYLFEGDPEQDDDYPFTDEVNRDNKKRKDTVSSLPATTITKPTVSTGFTRSRALSVPQDIRSPTRTPSHSAAASDEPLPGVTDSSALTRQAGLRNRSVAGVLSHLDQHVVELSRHQENDDTNNNLRSLNSNLAATVDSENVHAVSRVLGHRRLRSHPEFLRRQFGASAYPQSPGESQMTSTGTPSYTLRPVHTSPTQLVEQSVSKTPNKRPDGCRRPGKTSADSLVRRKPHQTHRRILSASAAMTPSTSRAGSTKQTLDPLGVRLAQASKRPPIGLAVNPLYQFNSSSKPVGPVSFESGLKNISTDPQTERKSSLPSEVTENLRRVHRTSCQPDSAPILSSPGRARFVDHSDRQIPTVEPSEEDDGQEADWDSEGLEDEDDDFDDANPAASSGSRLNPLQVLNRAMEFGACSAVRQYRHSLLAQPISRARLRVTSAVPSSNSAGSSQKIRHSSRYSADRGSLFESQLTPTEGFPVDSSVRHASLQHFSELGSPDVSGQSLGLTAHQSGLTVPLDHAVQQSYINQSNRGRIIRELKRAKLSSLASVENEEDPSESMFNQAFETLSSSDEMPANQTMRFRHVPSDSASFVGPLPAHQTSVSSVDPRELRPIPLHSRIPVILKAAKHVRTEQRYQPLEAPVTQSQDTHVQQRFVIGQRSSQRSFLRRGLSSDASLSSTDYHPAAEDDKESTKDELDATARANQREEGCWSKFKATCLIAYMFLVSSMDSLIRFLNGLTKQYRRIRRTIELEKRLVKRHVINNSQREEQSPLEHALGPEPHVFVRRNSSDFICCVPLTDHRAHSLNSYTSDYETYYVDMEYLHCDPETGGIRVCADFLRPSKRFPTNTVQQPVHPSLTMPTGCFKARKRKASGYAPISTSDNELASFLDIEAAVISIVSPEHDHSAGRNMLDCPSPVADHFVDGQGTLVAVGQSLEQLDALDRHHHQRAKAFRRSRSRAFLFLIALGNLAIVYSEWFCYLLLIVNHMRCSAILSLPYPLMVFLWGMLSVPRPTKTFWIFLITYTEVIIVIKYIFQFRFIYFNDPSDKPSESSEALWLPRLFGIDKNDHYAVFDLVQLITLFLHRGFLKNDGLWRDDMEFVQDLQLVTEGHKRPRKPSKVQHDSNRLLSCDIEEPLVSEDMNTHNVGTSRRGLLLFTHRNPNRTWNPFVKLRRFYQKMTNPQYNKKVDVYIYMFLCEFISFWIMIFGYVSFGPSTGMGDNAFEFIKSNRIPLPFISMLLVQFVFIIIDRGLFLRKQVSGKFIFQILHVLLIHGWLFFILPHITKSRFTSGIAPQLLYLIKCVYFSLSAYQIRSGYPLRILGNFLTKNYNYINLILFKGYLIIPFLYELRNVMDWMWTNSALSLYHWMELEDIYCKIFVLKCWRRSEIAYPTPRGVNRPAGKKALVGGLLLAFFFLCFWGPMTLSSFIGVTFDFNPPVLCTFSLSFGGFPPTFEFASREGNILKIDENVLGDFTRCHEKDLETVGFLHNFESNDIRYITIDGFSGNIWAITPPSYEALLMKLADPKSDLLIHFHMKCRRQTKEIQTSQTSVEDIFSRKLELVEKQQLLQVLNGTSTASPYRSTALEYGILHSEAPTHTFALDAVTLNAVMPRYVLLRKDRLRAAFARLGVRETYVNVSFVIHRDPATPQSWWELKERVTAPLSDPCFEHLRTPTLGTSGSAVKVLSVVTFNERVSDSLFGKVFSNYGIIGMYAAYIFLANRLLRTIYSNISYVICLEELPHVDRILNLCNEVYLVREYKLLRLEEQLVAKLFFLYRSSETMIKWTRHPKHIVEKFTELPETDSVPSQPQPLPPAVSQNYETAALLSDVHGQSGSNRYPDPDIILSPRSVAPSARTMNGRNVTLAQPHHDPQMELLSVRPRHARNPR